MGERYCDDCFIFKNCDSFVSLKYKKERNAYILRRDIAKHATNIVKRQEVLCPGPGNEKQSRETIQNIYAVHMYFDYETFKAHDTNIMSTYLRW